MLAKAESNVGQANKLPCVSLKSIISLSAINTNTALMTMT